MDARIEEFHSASTFYLGWKSLNPKENVPKKEFALASGVNNVTSISFLFLEHKLLYILSEHNFVLMSNILQTCLRKEERTFSALPRGTPFPVLPIGTLACL